MPPSHLILCRPLLLSPSIFPSIRVFSNESALRIRWLKYWSFSLSISPSNEYSWLIPFRIDQSDLLAVQEILKSLLQHYNPKASVFQYSAFYMVQLSHLHLTNNNNKKNPNISTLGRTNCANWKFICRGSDSILQLLLSIKGLLISTVDVKKGFSWHMGSEDTRISQNLMATFSA